MTRSISSTLPDSDAGGTAGGLAAMLGPHRPRAVFQPLVDLRSGEIMGYEALARGPLGTPYESPATMFTTAYERGVVPDLDWACRAAAYETALAAQLPSDLFLFVNTEPVSLGVPCPEMYRPVVREAAERLRVVMEVTERAIGRDPAALLAAVAQARRQGWGVALDDVGADPASLAMLPLVRPDVIKVDLSLIQGRTTKAVASVMNAVHAEAERTGATVLAEGIETPEHRDRALAMGATIGQGWWYGRPGPLPSNPGRPTAALRLLAATSDPPDATPFQLAAMDRIPRAIAKDQLMPMSRYLEERGIDGSEPSVVLACFQEERNFTEATQRRYARLVERSPFVGAVGVGMSERPMQGVRGARLRPDDPLRGEWNVIVLGAHFAGALLARDRGDDGPDGERRFDAILTHDRPLVVRTARALIRRLLPEN